MDIESLTQHISLHQYLYFDDVDMGYLRAGYWQTAQRLTPRVPYAGFFNHSGEKKERNITTNASNREPKTTVANWIICHLYTAI